MKISSSSTLILFLALVGATSCTFETREAPVYVPNEKLEKVEAQKSDIERATVAAARFHSLLNAGKSDELFDWIDAKSQLKSDQLAFDVRIGRIRRELGDVVSSELQRTAIFKKSGTLEARQEYITKFSKENDPRPRYELFFFELYPNGDTKLLGYTNGIDNEQGY